MGYSIVFYGLSWRDLQRSIELNEGDVLQIIRDQKWPNLVTGVDSNEAWNSVLTELRSAIGGTNVSISPQAASAFTLIVSTLGRFLGSLDHASASGDTFRDDFLEGVAATSFREPKLQEYLTERPILGFSNNDYPSWGGLRRQEVDRLMAHFDPTPPPDEDLAVWLEDLAEILEEAAENQIDIVTVYS